MSIARRHYTFFLFTATTTEPSTEPACPLKQTAPYLRGDATRRRGVKREKNEKVSIIEHIIPCRTLHLPPWSLSYSCFAPSYHAQNVTRKHNAKREEWERAHTFFFQLRGRTDGRTSGCVAGGERKEKKRQGAKTPHLSVRF